MGGGLYRCGGPGPGPAWGSAVKGQVNGLLSKNLFACCGVDRARRSCEELRATACCPLNTRSGANADRIQRSQPGQSAPVRTDRERAEDREEPDRLGLARTDRLSQDCRTARARTVAAAPGAAA